MVRKAKRKATQERLLDVDAVWQMARLLEYENSRVYLIDGELYEMMRPGGVHGELAITIGALIWMYPRT